MTHWIEVEALQPPFVGEVRVIHFTSDDRKLAVTPADFDRICNFLGTPDITERILVMIQSPDNPNNIRIKAEQQ